MRRHDVERDGETLDGVELYDRDDPGEDRDDHVRARRRRWTRVRR